MVLPTSHNRREACIHVPYVPLLPHVSVYRTYVFIAASKSTWSAYLCTGNLADTGWKESLQGVSQIYVTTHIAFDLTNSLTNLESELYSNENLRDRHNLLKYILSSFIIKI